MLNFKTWFVNMLVNDATLRGLLGAPDAQHVSIFPFDVDIQPDVYPVITYSDKGISMISVPKVHIGRFQIDIWSVNTALETENIYERVAQIINYEHSAIAGQPTTGTLWWMREESTHDEVSHDRRIWRKSVDYKIWFANTDGH